MLVGDPIYSWCHQQIYYLREDRLSGKKSTFVHAKLCCVVITKLAGRGYLYSFSLNFPRTPMVQSSEFRVQRKLIFKSSNLQILKSSNLQIFKSSNLQIFKSSNLQIFKSSNLQIFKSLSHPARQHRNIIPIPLPAFETIQPHDDVLMDRIQILVVILFKVFN
ncbi:hypothetical protein BH09BAC3_BH09BAC3_34430 [soil metagenome]